MRDHAASGTGDSIYLHALVAKYVVVAVERSWCLFFSELGCARVSLVASTPSPAARS